MQLDGKYGKTGKNWCVVIRIIVIPTKSHIDWMVVHLFSFSKRTLSSTLFVTPFEFNKVLVESSHLSISFFIWLAATTIRLLGRVTGILEKPNFDTFSTFPLCGISVSFAKAQSSRTFKFGMNLLIIRHVYILGTSGWSKATLWRFVHLPAGSRTLAIDWRWSPPSPNECFFCPPSDFEQLFLKRQYEV